MDSDEYATWRHDAVHALEAKRHALFAKLQITQWPARWDYDLDRGELTFSGDTDLRLLAKVQIVGSTGPKDWLWGWANSHWGEDLTKDARQTRDFGQTHAIDELTSPSLTDDDLNALGWELTAVAAKITDAVAAYRPQRDNGGGLFLLIRSIGPVSA